MNPMAIDERKRNRWSTNETAKGRQMMLLVYNALCWLVFLATLLYAFGFVANVIVPNSVDSGLVDSLWRSLLVDVALLSIIIGQQHIMMWPWFTPSSVEVVHPLQLPTRILFHSLGMLFLFRQWRPISNLVWSVENTNARSAIWIMFVSSSVLGIVASIFLVARIRVPFSPRKLSKASQTKVLQWFIGLASMTALFATPRMTAGHLLFSLGTLISIFFALRLTRRSYSSATSYYGETAQPESQLLFEK
jgi:hypothetical protein